MCLPIILNWYKTFAAAPPHGNRLAPECRQRCDHLFNRRWPRTEVGRDGSHIYPLADSDQASATGKARQCLVDCRSVSKVMQRARTQQSAFRRLGSQIHDPLRHTGHDPSLKCQKNMPCKIQTDSRQCKCCGRKQVHGQDRVPQSQRLSMVSFEGRETARSRARDNVPEH